MSPLFSVFTACKSSQEDYSVITEERRFLDHQRVIKNRDVTNDSLSYLISYAVAFLQYQDNVRGVSEKIASRVSDFVKIDQQKLERANITPLVFLVILTCFIPICIILIKNISSSMDRFVSVSFFSVSFVIDNDLLKGTPFSSTRRL